MLRFLLFLSGFHVLTATDVPIIGILSQPSDDYSFDTFIAASYVKFLESSGARVIPVWINQTKEYYERVVNYTNGVLFPGGTPRPFNVSGSYEEAAWYIYQLAVESNDRGTYFPLWGTCLGFEVFPYAQIKIDLRVACDFDFRGYTLDFVKDFRNSRLFSDASEELLNILANETVNYNYHYYCLSEPDLSERNISSDWKILTTNVGNDGSKYISTMESTRYPFYGVQFHPEKNAFEFLPSEGFPHSINAVKATHFFANFFVDEARKNSNHFPSRDLELQSLISNYCPKFSGLDDNYYYQMYGFNSEDYKRKLF